MFCANCGHRQPNNGLFCQGCRCRRHGSLLGANNANAGGAWLVAAPNPPANLVIDAQGLPVLLAGMTQPPWGPYQQPAAPPTATGGAAQPNQQGGGIAPTQGGAAPQQGFQPWAQQQQPQGGQQQAAQPVVTPPTNWAGVAKTGIIAGASLLALLIVGNALAGAFQRDPNPDGPDWNDAGVVEAGANGDGGTNPRAAGNGDASVPLFQGPLVVNNNTNNGVPGTQQPCGVCTETVDINRRYITFRGPKAYRDREDYLRRNPFPPN